MAFWDWVTAAGSNGGIDPGINFQENQLPSTVNDSARGMMAALAAWLQDAGGYATLGGSGNAFTLTLSQPMQTRKSGLIGFIATRTNADLGSGNGAVTMKVDATVAAPLRAVSGADFLPGQIISGAFYLMSWNSSTSEWLLHGKLQVVGSDLAAIAARSVLGNAGSSGAAPAAFLLTDLFASLEARTALVPPGVISDFAANAAPNGWLPCDGRLISRTTYAPLFSNIGTVWGVGDGSTTFAVPDFRGAFRRGWDNGRGLDTNNAARAFASYQADANQSHTHAITDPGHVHQHAWLQTTSFGAGASQAMQPGGPTNITDTPGDHVKSATTGISINSAGSAEAVPKNYAVLPIIRT